MNTCLLFWYSAIKPGKFSQWLLSHDDSIIITPMILIITIIITVISLQTTWSTEQHYFCFLSPQPDTSLHCKTMDTRLVHRTVYLLTPQLVVGADTHEGMTRLSWHGWSVRYWNGYPSAFGSHPPSTKRTPQTATLDERDFYFLRLLIPTERNEKALKRIQKKMMRARRTLDSLQSNNISCWIL